MMRKASIGTLFFTVFLDLLGFGLVIPFLPGVARQLGAGDFLAALTGTAYSLMQFMFVPIWGRLSDRIGRRPVLLWSIAASAVGMGLLSMAHELWLLFVARIFSGIATANIAVAQAYVADVTPPDKRAKGMGMIGMAFGLGMILGPFVGGEIEHLFPGQRSGAVPAIVAAALSVVNLCLALVTLPESLRRGGADPRTRPASGAFDAAEWRRALSVLGFAACAAITFLVVFWFSSVQQTFRLFTDDIFHMDDRGTGHLFGLIGLVGALVQGALLGPLSRRFGERPLIQYGLVLEALAFAFFGLCPLLSGAVARLTSLLAGCVLIAAGNGLINPNINAFISKRASSDEQGAILGRLQSLGALGRVLGPAAAGLLYQNWGVAVTYFSGALGIILALGLARGLDRGLERAPGIQTHQPGVAAR